MSTTDLAPVNTKPLSDATWANHHNQVGNGDLQSWTVAHDLAVQLWQADSNTLTWPQARELVSAASNGNPISITWDTRMGDTSRGERIETTTAMAVVDYLVVMPGNSDRVRLRYWGFGHYVYLSQITGMEVPQLEVSYRDA